MASEIEALIDRAFVEWDTNYAGPLNVVQFIAAALREAGLAVVRRDADIRTYRIGVGAQKVSTYATPSQAMGDAYRAMISAADLLNPGRGG